MHAPTGSERRLILLMEFQAALAAEAQAREAALRARGDQGLFQAWMRAMDATHAASQRLREGAPSPAPDVSLAPARIRVGMADDEPLLRAGLRRLLSLEPDLEWAGEAEDGLAAVDLVTSTRVDVLLLDVNMPRMGGLEALKLLTVLSPRTRVVMFTSGTEEGLRVHALREGAAGFLSKYDSPDSIARAVRHFAGASAAI